MDGQTAGETKSGAMGLEICYNQNGGRYLESLKNYSRNCVK